MSRNHSDPQGEDCVGGPLPGRRVGMLGWRLRLRSPETGLGITSDPVYLAAATPALPGMRVLDAGCGVGTAALCLAARVGGLDLHGLEFDEELVRYARTNGAENGTRPWTVHAGDLFEPPPGFPVAFDRVMTNPPWQRFDRSTPSPDRRRSLALREGAPGRSLSDWMAACAGLTRPDGVLSAIVPYARVGDALARLAGRSAEILPVLARAGRPPIKALLRVRRADEPSNVVLEPLVLHEGEGHTHDAERILREAAAISWLPAGRGRPDDEGRE